jgi:hypothetical protein
MNFGFKGLTNNRLTSLSFRRRPAVHHSSHNTALLFAAKQWIIFHKGSQLWCISLSLWMTYHWFTLAASRNSLWSMFLASIIWIIIGEGRLYGKEFLCIPPLLKGNHYLKSTHRLYNHLVLRAQCIIINSYIRFQQIIEYSSGSGIINQGITSSLTSQPNICCTYCLSILLFLKEWM